MNDAKSMLRFHTLQEAYYTPRRRGKDSALQAFAVDFVHNHSCFPSRPAAPSARHHLVRIFSAAEGGERAFVVRAAACHAASPARDEK